jgi:hypothetical protein
MVSVELSGVLACYRSKFGAGTMTVTLFWYGFDGMDKDFLEGAGG